MLPYVALMAMLVGLVLVASHRRDERLEWATKPLAALTFIAAAVARGSLSTTYGQILTLGLLLAAIGDVLLIPATRRTFLYGLASFLLGHLAYGAAFAVRGIDLVALVLALGALAIVATPILRWLWPHVALPMRLPVASYVVVITTMVALAVATHVRSPDPRIVVGAIAFYLSDLAVARNRFVSEGFVNRAWGLPLYFGSQLVLAWTIDSWPAGL
jgi:uncharacterized membrane protein YhhN